MSEQKWLTNKGGSWTAGSSMNSKVVLTVSQANSLAAASYNVSLPSLVFGDYSKWCASLMYYPLILNADDTEYKLSAGGIDYDTTVRGLITTFNEFGFTLGEYKYPEATSYLNFEPYTKIEVYLPYYGFATLKVADIEGKYIQFRLYVDYNTGQAQYVVGVNPNSVENGPYYPSVLAMDDTNTRILGTYNFQLGVSVPIGSTNFNETVRNTILGVGKAAISIGASFATDYLPTSHTKSTQKLVKTSRNPSTGRQITQAKTTKTREKEAFTYGTAERFNTAISTSATVLGNIGFSTQGITANNGSLNNNLCQSVAIVVTKAIPTINTETSSTFKALNGLPLGKCMLLGEVKGYTKVSDIRLEGDGFCQATQEEMAELEQLIYNGVIV